MSCSLCHQRPAAVCPGCVSHNVQRFNDRVAVLVKANQDSRKEITERIDRRSVSSNEVKINLQHIRRETVYTRDLVRSGQTQAGELRDRIAQRRQALEESRRQLQSARAETVTLLKTQNKLKRKEWRTVFERIVIERKRAVRESISLHRLRPLHDAKQIPGAEACSYELHGLSLSSIFCLRDYPVTHITQVVSHVANLTLHLAQYLGVKLPYEILAYSSSALQFRIQSLTAQEALSSLDTDPQTFARGLARLVVDVQHLCRTQGMEVQSEEEDLGRLLYGLYTLPSVGQYCDDIAYSAALDKDKRFKMKKATNWDVDQLSKRLADDMTTDPFEFIEKHLEQSEISVLDHVG